MSAGSLKQSEPALILLSLIPLVLSANARAVGTHQSRDCGHLLWRGVPLRMPVRVACTGGACRPARPLDLKHFHVTFA